MSLARASRPKKHYDWRKHYAQLWDKPTGGAIMAMLEQDRILLQEHVVTDAQLKDNEVCSECSMIATLKGYCPMCGINLRQQLTTA